MWVKDDLHQDSPICQLKTACRGRGKTDVGCNLVQAGNQPLKINIGPSLANLFRQHSTARLMSDGAKTSVPLHMTSTS